MILHIDHNRIVESMLDIDVTEDHCIFGRIDSDFCGDCALFGCDSSIRDDF